MGMSPFGGIDGVMFSVMPVLVTLVFVVVFGMFIMTIIRGVGEWRKNNASPVLTVEATLVAKRADITHHQHHHHNAGVEPAVHHHSTMSTSTTYYATFQVESGDRMEFRLRDEEYGLLADGDVGKLTFQGTRYLGFARGGD